jgi:hypothetical protein
MKFFTPELIAAYGSDDPAIWKEAEARWEAACNQYNALLASIRAELPAGLQHIEASYSLHDAVIRGMGRRAGTFVIMLQLDTPPQSLLTFTYDLVEEPRINPQALPPEARSSGSAVEWQYDELEKVPGQPPTWGQSILLSNGWEVSVHFRNVRVEEFQALVPALQNNAVPLQATSFP